jgi:hypothetical protein
MRSGSRKIEGQRSDRGAYDVRSQDGEVITIRRRVGRRKGVLIKERGTIEGH